MSQYYGVFFNQMQLSIVKIETSFKTISPNPKRLNGIVFIVV